MEMVGWHRLVTSGYQGKTHKGSERNWQEGKAVAAADSCVLFHFTKARKRAWLHTPVCDGMAMLHIFLLCEGWQIRKKKIWGTFIMNGILIPAPLRTDFNIWLVNIQKAPRELSHINTMGVFSVATHIQRADQWVPPMQTSFTYLILIKGHCDKWWMTVQKAVITNWSWYVGGGYWPLIALPIFNALSCISVNYTV